MLYPFWNNGPPGAGAAKTASGQVKPELARAGNENLAVVALLCAPKMT
jgi:hypothetical protein